MLSNENVNNLKEKIFNVTSDSFEALALEIFRFQYDQVIIYRQYCELLKKTPDKVNSLIKIPFLPISFFKSNIILGSDKYQVLFESSGTTGQMPSKHYISDLSLYEHSILSGFKTFFGEPSKYCFLALLPSYLERKNSSLVYMVQWLMSLSGHYGNGFYLNNHKELSDKISILEMQQKPYILLGVSFALLDFCEKFPHQMQHGIVLETGGMKGRKEEITRDALHQILSARLNCRNIFSEYGMTELLSQAYLTSDKKFRTPPWMRVLARDIQDPFSYCPTGKQGALNIIDLANLLSCSFIETEDAGIVYKDYSFDITGRIDLSELRGCNLMVS